MIGVRLRTAVAAVACVLLVGAAACRKRAAAQAPALGTPPGPGTPHLKITTTPSSARGPAPFTITIDACGSTDPDGDRLDFSFDFGDKNTKPLDYCQQIHTYAFPGSYQCQVCTSDGHNSACDTVLIHVS